MKPSILIGAAKTVFLIVFLTFTSSIYAQEKPLPKAKTGDFWEHVQIGGGIGASFGNDYTDLTIAPSAIYNFNEHFSFGTGLQYSRLKQKHYYSSDVYGGSLIGLYNPIEEIQLSLELEEVNVNNQYMDMGGTLKESFWNTGLFVGAGYHEGNVIIGARYNVLFNKDKNVYGDALMPFIRVFF